uniref:RING-type E3 ubiquitin transferase n=1 Tax=Aegilops tauschii TaxID=37682 RepID=N1QYA1_AEGTA
MEEAAAGAGEEEVYCAVGKEQWNWKANLRWVLANFPGRRLVLAHVHRPPHRINMMGAWVPVSQVGAAMVAACRKWEEDEASEALDQLLRICKAHRVDARKVIVSGDDLAGGLVQLVADHGVGELVMGAAADRAYSRKMRAPKSKKAATVQLKASPSCRIWFVCKGKLICTREASDEGLISRGEPSTASTSPRPTASDCSTSASSSHRHGDGAAEPVGIHDSTTPSHHGSGDAMEMDDSFAEKLKAEETRPQPEAVVESMPVTDGDHGASVLRFENSPLPPPMRIVLHPHWSRGIPPSPSAQGLREVVVLYSGGMAAASSMLDPSSAGSWMLGSPTARGTSKRATTASAMPRSLSPERNYLRVGGCGNHVNS